MRVPLILIGCWAVGIAASRANTTRQPVNVAGTWRYEIPSLKVQDGSTVTTCVVKGGIFSLKQSGTTLTGSSHGGTFSCGNEPPQPGTPAPIDSGIVKGDSVIFWLATLVHRGHVSGDTITGDMSGKTDVPMSGAFRMTKLK